MKVKIRAANAGRLGFGGGGGGGGEEGEGDCAPESCHLPGPELL